MTDKSTWPPGPWHTEPDEASWVDEVSGYQCRIHRMPDPGALCGYVSVPQSHPLYGMDIDDTFPATDWVRAMMAERTTDRVGMVDLFVHIWNGDMKNWPLSLILDAHRSVNYAQHEDAGWTFGFDCAHAGDWLPMMSLRTAGRLGSTYRNFEYVRSECTKLAAQLRTIALKAAGVKSEGQFK